jgi:hypothetical protein
LLVASADGTAASVYRNETPIAKECVLSWCVKKIESSYHNGNFEEKVVKTVLNTTAGPWPWWTKRVTIPGLGNGTLTAYLSNISISAPFDGENDTHYGVTNETAASASIMFDKIFPSFTTAANESANPVLRYTVRNIGYPTQRELEYNPWLHLSNISLHLERLGTDLTNAIRAAQDHKEHIGQAYEEEAYVKVRLYWLSFPLGLLLFSLVFLVTTMIRSWKEKENVGVWKTSAIATLLYGLPDNMHRKIRSQTSVGTPRARAKEMKVYLHPQKGWTLSDTDERAEEPKGRKYQPPPGWI